LPARLLGILSRQAGPALSLQVSRALFSARSNLLTGRFGRSFPIEPRRAVSPSPGLPGFSHWSRVLWVTVARSNFRCSDRHAAALRCGALRSFISGVMPATGSWPISTRRYSRDGRLCFVDCGGSHRTDPQSRAHGQPNAVVRSARGRRNGILSADDRSIQQGSYAVDGAFRCFDRSDAVGLCY
jgi:hypothetical protein